MVPVGHLVIGRVYKAHSNYNAYLIWLEEQRDWAILPKEYADRLYRIDEVVTAAIFRHGTDYPILSQKSSCFYRRLAESVFDPALKCGVQVRRVATVEHASFVKVALSGIDGAAAAIKLCLPYIRTFQERTQMTASLVAYATPIEEFIKYALSPAPYRAIRRVDLYRQEKLARVIVEPGTISMFLGRGGVNAAAVSKLTDFRVEPMDERELAAKHSLYRQEGHA